MYQHLFTAVLNDRLVYSFYSTDYSPFSDTNPRIILYEIDFTDKIKSNFTLFLYLNSWTYWF